MAAGVQRGVGADRWGEEEEEASCPSGEAANLKRQKRIMGIS